MFSLFAPIEVGDVTLVTVTGVHVDAAQRALQRSMSRLRFKRVLLISSEPATAPDPSIERIAIPPMTLAGYNRFILNDLHRYVDTTHALIVQADGFVLNPRRWNPQWLEFDYIGAPWPPMLEVDGRQERLKNQVGNGGFSLRSRKLLELAAAADLSTARYPLSAEDMFICNMLYDDLIAKGIRFPTPEEAARFSIETPGATFDQTLATAFGFHGLIYLRKVMPWWRRSGFTPPKAEGPDSPGPSRQI